MDIKKNNNSTWRTASPWCFVQQTTSWVIITKHGLELEELSCVCSSIYSTSHLNWHTHTLHTNNSDQFWWTSVCNIVLYYIDKCWRHKWNLLTEDFWSYNKNNAPISCSSNHSFLGHRSCTSRWQSHYHLSPAFQLCLPSVCTPLCRYITHTVQYC